MKEWRWDRLNEHLRREGFVSQLFGMTRLPLLVLAVSGLLVYPHLAISLYITSILTVFSVLQIGLGKQPTPVWTSKAILIGAMSLMITVAAAWLGMDIPLLPVLLVTLQPLVIVAAWLLLLPIDWILKRQIFEKARKVRAHMPAEAVVIGIAGSVGKTTTKELLKHVLQDLSPIATPAHVNTEMGVAQWLLQNEKWLRTNKPVIVEMGAYAKGEIALLCSVVKPTIGVVTALGSDHVALFGSEEAIIDANAELIEALPQNGHAFLNGDSEATRSIESRAHCPTALVGTHEGMHAVALDVEEKTDGLPGARHERTWDSRETSHPAANTFNVLGVNSSTIPDETYNISPLSMKAAMDWAAERKEKPKILLTSGLLELGKEEKKYLAELGRKASFFDRIIFTTDSGRASFAQAAGKEVELLGDDTKKIDQGGLLACVGRMPVSAIRRLLP